MASFFYVKFGSAQQCTPMARSGWAPYNKMSKIN